MKQSILTAGFAVGLVMGAASAAAAGFPTIPVRKCAADAVVAGTVCLDRYEASVWRVPNPTTTNASLVRKIQLGRATAGRPDGGRGDAVGHGERRLRAVHGQRPELRQRHLRREPAVGDPLGVHHVVPGAGSVRQCRQAAADERGVAGGGERDAGPGAGQRDDGLQHRERRRRRRSPARAAAAYRRAGPSTWWATWTSGWRTGCRSRRRARAGAASAMTTCASRGRARPRTGPGALVRGGAFASFGGPTAGPLAVIGTFRRPTRHDFIGFRCAR